MRQRPWLSALLAAVSGLASPAVARVRLGDRATEPKPKPASDEDIAAAFDWGASVRAGYFGGPVFGEGLEAFRRVGAYEVGLAGFYGTIDLGSALSAQDLGDQALAGFHIDQANLKTSLVEVEARKTLYDHVTVTGGLGYRQTLGHLLLKRDDASGSLLADATASTVFIAASLGSFWSWPSGFFLGADWIGVNLPLASSHAVKTSATGAAPASNQAELDSKANELSRQLAASPGFLLVLGSIGYRF